MTNRLFGLTLAAAALLALPLLGGCQDVDTELKAPEYKTGLPAGETRISAYKEAFPHQYASYQKNNETSVMTEYKGSVPFHKNDDVNPLPKGYKHAQPYLKNLWLGYPFMYEYNEARGHTYAVKDFVNIDRINRYGEKGGLPATCWNCKTPKMMEWIGKYGDAFWTKDVNTFRGKDAISEMDETIGCSNCHDPATMELSRKRTDYSNTWLQCEQRVALAETNRRLAKVHFETAEMRYKEARISFETGLGDMPAMSSAHEAMVQSRIKLIEAELELKLANLEWMYVANLLQERFLGLPAMEIEK